MPRNTGGVYSLPNPPFVSGTVISSTVMNQQLSDLASAMTESLSRSGNGDMQVPLTGPDGSAALPTYAWGSDPGSGFWLPSIGMVRLTSSAATLQQWTTTGVTINPPLTVTGGVTGGLAVTGNLSATAGLTATQSTANGDAVLATGNGTGAGVFGKGGTSDGPGVLGFGDAATPTGTLALGNGGLFVGGSCTAITSISTNAGVYGVGGDTSSSGIAGLGVVGRGGRNGTTAGGVGGVFIGGTPSAGNLAGGNGVNGIGAAGSGTGAAGAGGSFTAGTAATSTARQVAVAVTNGDISLSGVVAPATTTAVSNAITPINIAKAIAEITHDGSGNVAVVGGFNIASAALFVSIADGLTIVKVTFASAFSSTTYFPLATVSRALPFQWRYQAGARSTTTVEIRMVDAAGAHANPSTNAGTFVLVVYGAQ